MRVLLIISVLIISCDYYIFNYRLNSFLDGEHIEFNRIKENSDRLSRHTRVSGSYGFYEANKVILSKLEGINGIEIEVENEPSFQQVKNVAFYGDTNSIIGSISSTMEGNSKDIPTLIVISHYDTAVGTKGMNDNAAAVSASIEYMRLISNKKQRNINTVVVFTSNEEWGLLGAKSFFNNIDKYVPSRNKYFVNLEARGDFGVSNLFQFSEGIEGFVSSSNLFVVDSVLGFLYKNMPNITEIDALPNSYKEDSLFFNFAYFGNGYAYHNSSDRQLNETGVKHHLANLLSTYNHLNENPSQDINTKKKDFTYIQLGKNVNFHLYYWQLYSIWVAFIGIGLLKIWSLLNVNSGNKKGLLSNSIIWIKSFIIIILPLTIVIILIKLLSIVSYSYSLSTYALLVYIISLFAIFKVNKHLINRYNCFLQYRILLWAISVIFSITMSIFISPKLLWPSILLVAYNTYYIYSYQAYTKYSIIVYSLIVFTGYQLIEYIYLIGGINYPLMVFGLLYFSLSGILLRMDKYGRLSYYVMLILFLVIIYKEVFIENKPSVRVITPEFKNTFFADVNDNILQLPKLEKGACRYIVESTCHDTGNVEFISIFNHLNSVDVVLDGSYKEYRVLREKCFNNTLDISRDFNLQKITTGLSIGSSYDYFIYNKGEEE